MKMTMRRLTSALITTETVAEAEAEETTAINFPLLYRRFYEL